MIQMSELDSSLSSEQCTSDSQWFFRNLKIRKFNKLLIVPNCQIILMMIESSRKRFLAVVYPILSPGYPSDWFFPKSIESFGTNHQAPIWNQPILRSVCESQSTLRRITLDRESIKRILFINRKRFTCIGLYRTLVSERTQIEIQIEIHEPWFTSCVRLAKFMA